jgi:hypothetical protein
MSATLQEILLAPGTQPPSVADCNAVIEQEVSDKSGISGTARSSWPTRPCTRPSPATFAFKTEGQEQAAATLGLLGLPAGIGYEQVLASLSGRGSHQVRRRRRVHHARRPGTGGEGPNRPDRQSALLTALNSTPSAAARGVPFALDGAAR